MYAWQLEKDGQHFLFVGMNHAGATTIDAPKMLVLRRLFVEFQAKLGGAPAIAVIEPNVPHPKDSLEEAFRDRSETGVLVHLARAAGMPVVRGEKADGIWREVSDVMNRFDPDFVRYYYGVAREGKQWTAWVDDHKRRPEEFDAHFSSQCRSLSEYSGIHFDPQELRALHEKIFGQPLDVEAIRKDDPMFFPDAASTGSPGTAGYLPPRERPEPTRTAILSLREIARASTVFRIGQIRDTSLEVMESGRSGFALFGERHAKPVERAVGQQVLPDGRWKLRHGDIPVDDDWYGNRLTAAASVDIDEILATYVTDHYLKPQSLAQFQQEIANDAAGPASLR
jgi:hypothetical protein